MGFDIIYFLLLALPSLTLGFSSYATAYSNHFVSSNFFMSASNFFMSASYFPILHSSAHVIYFTSKHASNPYLTTVQYSSLKKSASAIYSMSNSHNNYCFTQPSPKPSFRPSQESSQEPSPKPSPKPSFRPSQESSQESSAKPSPRPSPKPSFRPSPEQYKNSIISFETLMSLSGLTQSSLDENAKTAVVIAVAKSANVSKQFVSFIKQTLKTIYSHKKTIQSYTYDIDTTTQIIIPVLGSPNDLYLTLTTNIANSVGNGDFNMFLMSASIALNSTSTQNAVSKSVAMTPMDFILPSSFPSSLPSSLPSSFPSSLPSSFPKQMPDQNYTEQLIFIIVVFVVIFIFVISSYIRAKMQIVEYIIMDIESI